MIWAAVILLLMLIMPRPGVWTIDDGVKRVATTNGEGVWAERISDGPVRSELTYPEAFPPLVPPFAYRVPGGFALGFSPLTRAFAKILGQREMLLRLVIALSAILLWMLMERAGIGWAFLLWPLSFYALVPWEHTLSWLLLWPAVWSIAAKRESNVRGLAVAGALAAPAMLLRPETSLLVVVLAVYLVVLDVRRVLAFVASAALVVAVLMAWHYATASEPWSVHIALNVQGKERIISWLASRPQTAYGLLLQMDNDLKVSLGMLAMLVLGLGLVMRGEAAKRKNLMIGGVLILGVWVAVFQYRLWSHLVPPVALLGMNSLLATMPWVVVLARPPYRGRTALWLAVVTIGLTVLLTPVWQGVHWGPRIMLFAIPLLLIDLKQTNRARGVLFVTLLGVAAVQSLSSMALVYARDDEVAGRCRQLEKELGPVVVCPGPVQCADLASLWPGREFFTAATTRELRQLLMEFRQAGVDTCWLHLEGHDRLYEAAFPEVKPVHAVHVHELQAGSLYRTQWKVLTLTWNTKDTLWTGVLEAEAGMLLKEGREERALQIQEQAVELSPQSAQVHHNLALIHAALGNMNEARAEVQRALEIDSTLKESRLLWEDLLRRSGGAPANGEPRPNPDREPPPD